MKRALNNPVIYVVGPTASGKTALSIEIAKRFGGQIICGDSMQVYKNMPIATAAPTKEEMSGVRHRLFEFLDPSEKFSVSDFVLLAKKEIEEVKNEGALPIVVGGTGLYITSLAENIDFGAEENDGSIRKSLEQRAEKEGLEALYNELCLIDSVSAQKISKNDAKRIIRALEVYILSGENITERKKKSREKGIIYDNIFIGVNYLDRQTLYDRINKRVDIMLDRGILEEAKNCYNKGNKTSAQAIGHKELIPFLNGEISLEEATEHLKMQTRRYAKRQITWFSKNEEINWVYMDDDKDPILKATEIIKAKLL